MPAIISSILPTASLSATPNPLNFPVIRARRLCGTGKNLRIAWRLFPGMLAVSTGSYGDVRVETEIHTSEPELQLDQWDHVTEGRLEMKTQDLTIIGCIDNGGEVLAVTPGFYRV
jgi:hypothetical protein